MCLKCQECSAWKAGQIVSSTLLILENFIHFDTNWKTFLLQNNDIFVEKYFAFLRRPFELINFWWICNKNNVNETFLDISVINIVFALLWHLDIFQNSVISGCWSNLQEWSLCSLSSYPQNKIYKIWFSSIWNCVETHLQKNIEGYRIIKANDWCHKIWPQKPSFGRAEVRILSKKSKKSDLFALSFNVLNARCQ